MNATLLPEETIALEPAREAETESAPTSQANAFGKLIDDYIENRHCLELLRFFGSHPRTRFNKLAIIPVINGNGHRAEVESALAELTEREIVQASTQNDTTLYSLTENETRRRQAFKLIQLAWYRGQTGLPAYNAVPTERDGRRQ